MPLQVIEPTYSAATLKAWCVENGRLVLPGDRVREDVAALILDRSVGTLQNWRSGERPIPYTSVRGRASYSLCDLADFLNANQC